VAVKTVDGPLGSIGFALFNRQGRTGGGYSCRETASPRMHGLHHPVPLFLSECPS